MIVSIIVAVSSNNVIGKDNKLPWHLPADLKYFKGLTMGHHMIMGRKTFESIGKALPGRTSVIITRNEEYRAQNCIVVGSLESAITKAASRQDGEAFIIGGAEVIRHGFNLADKIYLTEIHKDFEGDIFLPKIDRNKWKEISRIFCKADEKNPFDYSFVEFLKA